ncbi:hypothetical protein J6590_060839 [Homalodisca vitripennis]|nr:hypothetical protein J6590_060839 [Homalodisca vitripennis]
MGCVRDLVKVFIGNIFAFQSHTGADVSIVVGNETSNRTLRNGLSYEEFLKKIESNIAAQYRIMSESNSVGPVEGLANPDSYYNNTSERLVPLTSMETFPPLVTTTAATEPTEDRRDLIERHERDTRELPPDYLSLREYPPLPPTFDESTTSLSFLVKPVEETEHGALGSPEMDGYSASQVGRGYQNHVAPTLPECEVRFSEVISVRPPDLVSVPRQRVIEP